MVYQPNEMNKFQIARVENLDLPFRCVFGDLTTQFA